MCSRKSGSGRVPLQVLMLAIVLLLGAAGWAEAQCPAGFTDAGAECQLNADITATGTVVFTKTVHLLAGSSITALDATGFTLQINSGNFIMEATSELDGDQPGTCPRTGAPITVDLRTGQGNIDLKPGSFVHSQACQGGFIQLLTAGTGTASIDGVVESVGTQGGSGVNRPGGGPITIVAGCELTVSDEGVVSSRGKDPGADLVHLEGCVVTIFGLVESTGAGHTPLVNNPPNSCSDVPPGLNSPPRRNPVTRPGKPQNSTACVEIWAGTTLLIDATGTHHGQVRADTGAAGGSAGTGWIELLANLDITIRDGAGNDAAPNNSPREGFAVHANGLAGTNDDGGLVDVISKNGSLFTFGKALQASHVGIGGGGGGGTIHVQVNDDAVLGTAIIEARGKDFGGGQQNGGTIIVRAATGQITGAQPGELDAFGGPPLGSVTLTACTADPAVTYTGTSTPPAVNIQNCTPQPVFPAYATPFPLETCFDVCEDRPQGVKRGTKFLDVDGNGLRGDPLVEVGLSGWTIKVFQAGVEVLSTVTNGNGAYQFILSPGTYVVCEVLQAGWTQTGPPAGPGIVDCNFEPGLGPRGYEIVILEGTVDEGNDFGNQPPEGECPKFPTLEADLTITIDPSIDDQIQKAIEATAALGDNKTLLILPHLGQKTETIVINDKVRVFGCSITLFAAEPGQPVVTITAGANGGTTTDVHATGSAVAGYKLEGTNHTVKNTRSFDNAIGFWITGNGNTVIGAQGTDGNGIGFKIDGDNNVVDSASGVTNSLGDGAQISVGANGNTIKKSTFSDNNGDGILVQGASNTISENKLYSNAGDGIHVTGASNALLKNKAGEVGKGNGQNGILVTGNGGPLTENRAEGNGQNGIQVTGNNHRLTKNLNKDNTGCEFVIAAGNLDGLGNKANDVAFNFGVGGVGCQE